MGVCCSQIYIMHVLCYKPFNFGISDRQVNGGQGWISVTLSAAPGALRWPTSKYMHYGKSSLAPRKVLRSASSTFFSNTLEHHAFFLLEQLQAQTVGSRQFFPNLQFPEHFYRLFQSERLLEDCYLLYSAFVTCEAFSNNAIARSQKSELHVIACRQITSLAEPGYEHAPWQLVPSVAVESTWLAMARNISFGMRGKSRHALAKYQMQNFAGT